MNRAPTPVYEPRLLAAMRELELTARRLVAEAAAGLHPSRRPGVAREFSQYRAYQPGDDPRHIDWKLFARSDRYFLRESELDTRVDVSLILDATESMQHRGMSDEMPRKFDLARQLAAAFALLAEMQGDAATLHIVAHGEVESIVTAGRRQPFPRIVHALARTEPSGSWPLDSSNVTRSLRRALVSRSSVVSDTTARVTVVLTDGHEHGGEIRAALAPLRAQQHEILLLQLIARDEREFTYRGPIRFVEWETGRVVEAEAGRVRAAFLESERRQREAWRRAWGGDRFNYLGVMTDEPLVPVLRAYLRRRAGKR